MEVRRTWADTNFVGNTEKCGDRLEHLKRPWIRVREAQGAIKTGKRSQRSYNVSAEAPPQHDSIAPLPIDPVVQRTKRSPHTANPEVHGP